MPRFAETLKLAVLVLGNPRLLGSIYLPDGKFDITFLAVGFDMI